MALDENFLNYSGLDSICTFEIQERFWPDLGQFVKAYDLTTKILPVLMFMQTRGVRVSMANLEETKKDIRRAMTEKQAELDEIVGRHLNVDSPKQCQEYFYGELGIPPYLNKAKKPTVDDLTLQRLVRGTAARPGLRQAKLIQEIRGLGKLYGTYLDMAFDADGRMRGSYNPRGTKFGRLSSSKTVFGTGMNFQNLPEDFKKFLVPDPGYVFMEMDKRQAEWVVVAYISGDANMIKAIEEGVDVHTHTASLMFDVPIEVIKQDSKIVGHSTDADFIRKVRLGDPIIAPHYSINWPRTMSLRQCGKKSNHGLNYDEGYRGFALINEIEEKEAKKIVTMYHNIYLGIRKWYEHVKYELQNGRILTNCFGRSVRFLGHWNDSLWKSAYSMIPQSTVVDSLNDGMVKIYNDRRLCGKTGFNIDILAQVHDSILMQVPIEVAMKMRNFKSMLTSIADYSSPILCYGAKEFRIASDFKFGMNWGSFHPDHNPQGMKEIETYEDFTTAMKEWENGAGVEQLA